MGKIIKFLGKHIEPLHVRDKKRHRIIVEILGGEDSRRIRWQIQFEIQEVAGLAALRGFKDKAVASGYRHEFTVISTKKLRRFVADTFKFIRAGKAAVWIDGNPVRPQVARQA